MQDAADSKLLGAHDVCLDTGAGTGVYMSVLHLGGEREENEITGRSAVKDFAYKCGQRDDEDVLRVQLTKDGDTHLFRRRDRIYLHSMRDTRQIISDKCMHVTTLAPDKSYLEDKDICADIHGTDAMVEVDLMMLKSKTMGQ